MPKARLVELDFLRSVSTISVVLIHVTAAPLAEANGVALSILAYMTINQLARFSIAAFVFIAGVAFFYNYDDNKPFALGPFLKRRCSFVLVPYLFWSVFYSTISLSTSGNLSIKLFIANILLGNSSYHLYFVVLIFQFYILAPLFFRFCRLTNEQFKWVLSICFVSYMLLMVHNRYGSFENSSPLLQVLYRYRDRNFLYWLFYFVLGAYVARYWYDVLAWIKHNSKFIVSTFILSLAIATGEAYYGLTYQGLHPSTVAQPLRPTMLIYTIAAIAMFLMIEPHVRSVRLLQHYADTVAENSFAIYLAHPAVLTVLTAIGRFIALPRLVFLAISTVLALVVPVLGAQVAKKITPTLAPFAVGK